jgi:N-sulfoglucosamine sulfohydrolase
MKTRSLILASLLVMVLTARAAADTNRYNILFCFADDWGRYASAYAALDSRPSLNHVVRTPAIDRVAREGAIFRNAFVPAPSCTPCRSSIVSGRYWWNTGQGAILVGAVWDETIPTFPLLLRDGGYHIGKSYKVWSPGTPADAPFGRQRYAYQKAGGAPNNFSEQVTTMVKSGATVSAGRERLLSQVRSNFTAFLADGQSGRPWLYWFGPTTTHRTWIKGSGKQLWGIEPDSLKGKLPAHLPDVPEVREDVADYLGECQAFDAYVAVLLEQLERAGELERTVIVVSGDHGMPGVPGGKCNLYDFGSAVPLMVRWPGGKGGRVVDDFVNLMDLGPTFMEIGGVALPAGVNGRSIVPLLTSTKSGQIDPARDHVILGRERHVGSARPENRPYPMRGIRTKDFLYIRNFEPGRWPMGAPLAAEGPAILDQNELEQNTRLAFPDMDAGPTKAWLVAHRADPEFKSFYARAFEKRPLEEFYDLRSDPDQVRNVAGEASFLVEKNAHWRRLSAALRDTGDPRVTENGKRFENPPFTEAEPPERGRPAARQAPGSGPRPAQRQNPAAN